MYFGRWPSATFFFNKHVVLLCVLCWFLVYQLGQVLFPKLALANGVLTVLYKGPWLRRRSVDGCRGAIILVKMCLESSGVQKPLVKVQNKYFFCKKCWKNEDKMALPSLCGLLESWLPWLPPGSLLRASWEPPGSLLGASRGVLGASWEPLGSLLGASWEPPGCLLGAS